MSKISFSTKPRNVYYTYKTNCGDIYCIGKTNPLKPTSSPNPTSKSWNCYFECDAYTENALGKYSRLYVEIDTGKHLPVSPSTFYTDGMSFSYYEDGTYKPVTLTDTYYNVVGEEYNLPNNSLELPHVDYTDGDDKTTTYYFDTLIACGDTYKDGTFSKENDDETTYADDLLGVVKNNISTSSWHSTVDANIPEYLKENIDDIGYTAPDFSLFGELFIEKLLEEMVAYGESVAKTNAVTETDEYKGVELVIGEDKKSITCTSVPKDADQGGEEEKNVESDDKTEYSVTVKHDENGTASASKTKGKKGDEVTITTTPKEGYELDKITAVGATIADKKFTIGEADVTVTVTFKLTQA